MSKQKEIKISKKSYGQIKAGIKPYIFLKKTEVEHDDDVLLKVNNTDLEIPVSIKKVVPLKRDTQWETMKMFSNKFMELLKNHVTKENMSRYYNKNKIESAYRKHLVDEKRIANGEKPIYAQKIMEEQLAAVKTAKWLQEIGYNPNSPKPFIIEIKIKEN